MKLFALLLLMPILSFSATTSEDFGGSLNPATLQAGTNVEAVSKFFGKKATTLADGKISYSLRVNTIDIDNVTLKDAYLVSDNGTVSSLTLEFNQQNGEKFLADIIEKYGMPVGEMIDAYEWKNNNVIFEIHPTSEGYAATYKPLNNQTLAAKF